MYSLVAPVFEKHMFNLVAGVTALTALPESLSEGAGLPVDFDAVVHRAMAESMLMLIIGNVVI